MPLVGAVVSPSGFGSLSGSLSFNSSLLLLSRLLAHVSAQSLVCSLACLSSPPGKGKGNVCYAGYICSFFSFWTKLSWLNSIDSINFGVIKLTKKFDFVSLIALDCWTNGKTIGGLKFDWFVVWFGAISWLRREN